jgi:hypothetical protein
VAPDDDDDNNNNNNRHDSVCAEVNFNICKELGVKLNTKHRYDHAPKLVETDHEDKVTILGNQPVRTDRTVSNNKPDSIIFS